MAEATKVFSTVNNGGEVCSKHYELERIVVNLVPCLCMLVCLITLARQVEKIKKAANSKQKALGQDVEFFLASPCTNARSR